MCRAVGNVSTVSCLQCSALAHQCLTAASEQLKAAKTEQGIRRQQDLSEVRGTNRARNLFHFSLSFISESFDGCELQGLMWNTLSLGLKCRASDKGNRGMWNLRVGHAPASQLS